MSTPDEQRPPFTWEATPSRCRPGDVSYVLDTELIAVAIHLGRWRNNDENAGRWALHVRHDALRFLPADLTDDEAKALALDELAEALDDDAGRVRRLAEEMHKALEDHDDADAARADRLAESQAAGRFVARAKVASRRNAAGEFVVRAYDQYDRRLPDADYFANDRADAESTAKMMNQEAQAARVAGRRPRPR
jgi:hypothetical protein